MQIPRLVFVFKAMHSGLFDSQCSLFHCKSFSVDVRAAIFCWQPEAPSPLKLALVHV